MKKLSHCFSIILSLLQHGIKSLIFLDVFSSFFFSLLLNGFRCILLRHHRSYHHPLFTINLSNITKLSSTNYLTWSLQIQYLLEGYDLHHFIDDAHTPPPLTVTVTGVASLNPAYTTWKYQDRLIFSTLLGAIFVSLQPLIAHTTTSLDVWQTLTNTYAKSSRYRIKQLKEQLQRCTKDSLTYWTYAFAIAVYLINCMPTPTLHLSSPFDKLFESPSNYTKLRVFDCLCYPWFHSSFQHKLDFCSTRVFLGYSSTQSAYIVYLGHHPISSVDQLADTLTKPLLRSHFQELQVKIGISSGAPSWGGLL